MTPFDIKNIVDQKQKFEWDSEMQKAYVPFVINRAMSFNLQSVLFANAMNKYPTLSPKQQFDFYYHGVPKGKRFDKWHKAEAKVDDVKMLQEYYDINMSEASNMIGLLTDDQLNELRTITSKGGK